MTRSLLFCAGLLFSTLAYTQDSIQTPLRLFEPAPEFNKPRFWTMTGLAIGGYGAAMIGLNQLWYADYERSSFQLFDDSKEWNQMDKAGHAFTAYFQTAWAYGTARWTGLDRNRSLIVGVTLSTLFQTSIEILDGHSEKWGFSFSDVAFNTLGTGLFVGQELLWKEQRIRLKVSSGFKQYPNDPVPASDGISPSYTVRQRADDLFGGSYPATFLKDYNRMTIWASFNINSFTASKNKKLSWLNLSLGYGAENLYGGFLNRWENDGVEYVLDNTSYPRYRQFFLAPDIDLQRISTKSPFVRTLLGVLNIIKVPSPALEMNTRGKVKWHWLFW